VIQRAADFHRARKSASVQVKLQSTHDVPGMPKNEQSISGSFAVARPNQLALRLKEGDKPALNAVSDGRTVWVHIAEINQYIVDDSPADLETLLRDNPYLGSFLGQMGPIGDLFRDKPKETFLQGVTVLSVVGSEDVSGVKCVHLRGEQEEMDWHAWFQEGAEPALRKFTFSPLKGVLANAPDQVKEKLKGAKMDMALSYDGWKFDADLAKDTFAFEPPQGAKKVARFGPPDEEGPGAADGPNSLKGKPAADFTLAKLGGGEVQLAAHKGKDVVILDFWATWCGPCVRAMPILSEVAGAFKDRNVVVYAVNQREEEGVVKKFMEDKKLALPVLMDAKAEVAKSYKVRGIPQTVIIDKEGNVAAVHVGFSPSLKAQLTKKLDALLAK
jgi:peroxiredoxin